MWASLTAEPSKTITASRQPSTLPKRTALVDLGRTWWPEPRIPRYPHSATNAASGGRSHAHFLLAHKSRTDVPKSSKGLKRLIDMAGPVSLSTRTHTQSPHQGPRETRWNISETVINKSIPIDWPTFSSTMQTMRGNKIKQYPHHVVELLASC